jgi:hypothetical protein
MDGENLRRIIGKRVYLELTSGRKYTGIVEAVDREGSPVIFVYMKDKFDELVIFPSSEIKFLEVEE